jgi:hypothetical protein
MVTMPNLSIAELSLVVPRWPTNSDGVEAPEGICGDYMCECSDEARVIMTEGEYQLAFGVPKEFGLDEEELAEFEASRGATTVTTTERRSRPRFPFRR